MFRYDCVVKILLKGTLIETVAQHGNGCTE